MSRRDIWVTVVALVVLGAISLVAFLVFGDRPVEIGDMR